MRNVRWGLRLAATVSVAALLAACGGDDAGGEGASAAPAAGGAATASAAGKRLRALSVPTDTATLAEIERLMGWAESALPTVFSTPESTHVLDPYLYRFYPRTGHYLAVTERTVLVLGPLTNDQVLVVGTLDDFACVADLARCVAPTLVRQPQGATVAPGVEVVFSAEVGGGPALRLQWLRDGEPIAGANSATLSFTAAAADNGARFSLRAENAKGAVDSELATLTVVTPIDGAAMQALAQSRGCFECHSIERAGSGPAWRAVAQRYDGVADAAVRLAGSITGGSSRQWGFSSAMPAQPVSANEARDLATWILTLK